MALNQAAHRRPWVGLQMWSYPESWAVGTDQERPVQAEKTERCQRFALGPGVGSDTAISSRLLVPCAHGRSQQGQLSTIPAGRSHPLAGMPHLKVEWTTAPLSLENRQNQELSTDGGSGRNLRVPAGAWPKGPLLPGDHAGTRRSHVASQFHCCSAEGTSGSSHVAVCWCACDLQVGRPQGTGQQWGGLCARSLPPHWPHSTLKYERMLGCPSCSCAHPSPLPATPLSAAPCHCNFMVTITDSGPALSQSHRPEYVKGSGLRRQSRTPHLLA